MVGSKTKPELEAAVVSAYLELRSPTRVAERLGLCPSTVRNIVKRNHLPPPPTRFIDPPTPEEDAKIRAMLEDGVSLREISRDSRFHYAKLCQLYPERWTPQQSGKFARAVGRARACR